MFNTIPRRILAFINKSLNNKSTNIGKKYALVSILNPHVYWPDIHQHSLNLHHQYPVLVLFWKDII